MVFSEVSYAPFRGIKLVSSALRSIAPASTQTLNFQKLPIRSFLGLFFPATPTIFPLFAVINSVFALKC